ncbi:MAG: 2-C-methyl-D-erythritol 4-phosphate cytidylyltransferase [Salinibacterium sp.]|nr:2-C-methyl-D-erythritol 4-phosphate cytidylyltransferase [Salinibacterium sp.]
MPIVGIIVVAAGSGARLGAGQPKAFADVDGVPMLERALRGVFGSVEPAQVVVVAPASHLDVARSICDRVAGVASGAVSVVAGGVTRQDSVALGLQALDDSVEIVLVHDAARALTPSALFDRVVGAVAASGHGIIPSLPVSDTIKRVAERSVVETVDRSSLVHVQTPQGFPRESLVAAYAEANQEFTDDAALYSNAGDVVDIVDGEPLAFKITTPWDLARAENVLAELRPVASIRTGVGIDVHAYDPGEPLWLGGLYWPDEVGLAGHSDGDAMCHAICDALLSAAGLGDIGGRFGTDDPRFAGAHGEVFLAETLALVTGSGWTVGNVSVQLIAKHPRLGARRTELEHHLSSLVDAPVSVSATTSDGLGFTGRAEGVAVIATALVQRA